MGEIDKISVGSVKYSGIFDFKQVYDFGKKILKEKGYDVFEEENYGEKISGKIDSIKWKCLKKVSDYFKARLSIKLSGKITSVKAKKGRKKVNMNKGNLTIKVTSLLIKDYEGDWEESPINKFFREIYDSWIITGRVSKYKKKVRDDAEQFLSEMREYLGMREKVL